MDVPKKDGDIAIGGYFRVLQDKLVLLLVNSASNTREISGGLLDVIKGLENNLEQSIDNCNKQMLENRQMTKRLDDYKSHIESLKKEIKTKDEAIEYYEDKYGDYK
ncbi:hypothetical protein LPJ72_005054 [Coemansia sp. Benny D160-2]|nr:hypothetical protein LPJ72_005054 [Coemansia sp. Benny D160-2]